MYGYNYIYIYICIIHICIYKFIYSIYTYMQIYVYIYYIYVYIYIYILATGLMTGASYVQGGGQGGEGGEEAGRDEPAPPEVFPLPPWRPPHPGGNPGAYSWFIQSTPMQMPPKSGGRWG